MRILVVDDDEAIRELLGEFLRSLGYEIETARDGQDALAKLSRGPCDLVLSDVNMPRMNGIELLKRVREFYPQTRRVLITSYEISEYFALALEHDIGNIIAKALSFNLDDVAMVVRNLLSGDFFGLERHLRSGTEIRREKVRSTREIAGCAERVAAACPDETLATKVELVVSELLQNAVCYGPQREAAAGQDSRQHALTLAEHEAVEVCWGRDPGRYGVSVADPFGRLRKKDVLYWLARQSATGENGLPVGVLDTHGRGLYIARSQVDSLIINIRTGQRTEVTALWYSGETWQGSKPLYINEI